MGDAGGGKRYRDESAEIPKAKRLREADIILEILDDVDSGVDQVTSVDGLSEVIKSLEEEVVTATAEVSGPPQPPVDLGYLLEASDDELGLPPAVGSSSSSATDGGDGVEVVDGESGFGQGLWGFEDEFLGPYEGLEFGILENERGIFENGDCFYEDGLLFDSSDLVSGPLDYDNWSWQTESQPSV